jgi:hypothetical protein
MKTMTKVKKKAKRILNQFLKDEGNELYQELADLAV